jgi:pimeloyl-ACP methyl ester carboxylesterase
MTLSDGRVLGYAEAGDPKGRPLFLFHGLNSSRLEVHIVHEKMKKAGIRVIGVDRPGMGLSTFQDEREVLDFVDDIVYLADKLHIDNFSVMGVSAGTPYALACAYKIPHRVISCGIISGVAPVFECSMDGMPKESRTFIFIAQKLPCFVRPVFWFLQGRLSQNDAKADQFLGNIMFALDDIDKRLIEDATAKKALLETFRESYRQGSKGVAYDGILVFGKPWGFSLEEIDFSSIYLWHGEKDSGTPVSMAKAMVEKISGATLKVYPNDGHLSIVFNQMDEIIDDFVKGYKQCNL